MLPSIIPLVSCTLQTGEQHTQGTVKAPTWSGVQLMNGGYEERIYLSTRPQNDLERPKQYIEADNPNNPRRMTGLRPT